MLLSAEHLSINFGSRQLLEDVNFYLNEGDKVGVIGINGTGKSTFLKVLAGRLEADAGTISRNPNVQVSLLEQNPPMEDDATVLEQVFLHFPKEFRELNEYEAKTMLNKLGLPDYEQKVGTLSGGQRKRVALAAALIHNRLLLVGPVQVARRVIGLLGEKITWEALGFTFGRISLGFFLAFLAALVLAALSARFPWVETLLRPYILAVQTVPVASFIVIALLWLSSRRISAFIAFLMVLPVLYANALQGIREADPQLLEMARVFRLSGLRRVRCIILPSLAPYLKSACHVALGVAAEVMAVANRSVGGMLYDAKVYLEISDLFAWTVLLVAVSILFEKAFLWLLDLCVNRAIRWEG